VDREREPHRAREPDAPALIEAFAHIETWANELAEAADAIALVARQHRRSWKSFAIQPNSLRQREAGKQGHGGERSTIASWAAATATARVMKAAERGVGRSASYPASRLGIRRVSSAPASSISPLRRSRPQASVWCRGMPVVETSAGGLPPIATTITRPSASGAIGKQGMRSMHAEGEVSTKRGTSTMKRPTRHGCDLIRQYPFMSSRPNLVSGCGAQMVSSRRRLFARNNGADRPELRRLPAGVWIIFARLGS
jgi:hypothetical protein